MAGTVRGKIECLISTGNAFNQGQNVFTSIYRFLKTQLEPAGVVTEIARHGGLSSTAANVNYHDEADPFLTNAWFVFRFNTNGGRTWPWYLLVQWARGDTSDFGQSPGSPGLILNSSAAPAPGESIVGYQCAVGIGGDQNPWNGTTGAQATKGSPVWRVPANGGTNVAVFPRSNSADWLHGIRAKGQIVAVAGSQLVDGETFTIGDGLTTVKVFEFDTNGSVTPGNYAVTVTPLMSKYEVRDAIIAAINSLLGIVTDFYVAASVGGGERVLLRNRQPGAVGNVTITHTVADPDFTVTGMAGGSSLMHNCRPNYFTSSSSPHRVQMLADEDSFIYLLDYGAVGAYYGQYMGIWIPRTGVVTSNPFVALSGALPMTEGWLGSDYNGDSSVGTDVGCVVVNTNTGARVMGLARYTEVLTRQPNVQFSPTTYNELPVGVSVGERVPTSGDSSWSSFLGKFDPAMLRETYNVPTHDTNVGRTRAVFGSGTVAETKWTVPWDGVTVPGTGVTRDGVTF